MFLRRSQVILTLLAWEPHQRSTELEEMDSWQDFVIPPRFLQEWTNVGGWLNLGSNETSVLEKLTFNDVWTLKDFLGLVCVLSGQAGHSGGEWGGVCGW